MVNGERLKNSYVSMVRTEMTEDRRKELWVRAKARFPELSAFFLEQFENCANVSDNNSIHDRLLGSTFMFLALTNAIESDPIVSWASPIKSKKQLLGFGYLKPLEN